MTRRDDTVALRHMRDHVAEAVALSAGRSRSDLDSDRIFSLALVKLVEIVGEAARRVSVDRQADLASIPWSQIIATRNRLVHGYDAVDLDILWRIAADELPVLLQHLETALEEDATNEQR